MILDDVVSALSAPQCLQ